jgi:hypothetical protein
MFMSISLTTRRSAVMAGQADSLNLRAFEDRIGRRHFRKLLTATRAG